MGRVFITRAIPGTAARTLREAGHEVEVWPGELPPAREALEERLATADAAMTMVTDRIDAGLLAGCGSLRILANMAVGYDNVDPAMAAEAGVWLTNTPGVLAETTADLAFGLLLDAARRISLSARETLEGRWKTWSPTAYLGADAFGATLGIIGPGEIGTAMARRGRGFSMRILYTSRGPRPSLEAELGAERRELDALLSESDFVSIHTPLTAATRRFIGVRELALMKPTAILINTSRGGVLDQDALVAALGAGTIAGAALDVTDPEPLPIEHPLFSFPNVVITPHIASASTATRSRMAEMAAANIIAVLDGRDPPNAVNRPPHPRGT